MLSGAEVRGVLVTDAGRGRFPPEKGEPMRKYVKLSAPVFLDCDHLQMVSSFSKDAGGYVIECCPVGYRDGMVSWTIGPEYFEISSKTTVLVIPAGRRSEKRQNEVDDLLKADYEKYATDFLARIGRSDLEVIRGD